MNHLYLAIIGSIRSIGITTAQLERDAGLSNGAINKLKHGRPTEETLTRILNALPPDLAEVLVIASAKDATPPPYRDRIRILLDSNLKETPPIPLPVQTRRVR